MEREVVKSYFEANCPTLIKHNMFDKFDTKSLNIDESGIVLDDKVLARSGDRYIYIQ